MMQVLVKFLPIVLKITAFIIAICGLHHCHCQLIVNVKAQSGEILKESFFTNASDDSVTLEFSLQDGSHTAQIVDFKQELQIFRVIMLGEEELDQSPFQVFCFVTKFAKGDFISSDAMSKLRQKNPTTVRTPEGDHGTEEFTMDLSLDVEGSSFISSHIPSLCAAASSSTYASEKDLKLWVTQKQDVDWDWSTVREATRRLPAKGLSSCIENSKDSSCICNHQICISWYPCGLKYCTGKDNSGKTVSYRCGIRTCRKCYKFNFYVTQKQACLTALE
ncbi:UNVERIFIED_CONTAM: hypothetical protein RMT77_012050 [Armadillidium vulgare]